MGGWQVAGGQAQLGRCRSEQQALRPSPAKERTAVWTLVSPGRALPVGLEGRALNQARAAEQRPERGPEGSVSCWSATREVGSRPGTWGQGPSAPAGFYLLLSIPGKVPTSPECQPMCRLPAGAFTA